MLQPRSLPLDAVRRTWQHLSMSVAGLVWSRRHARKRMLSDAIELPTTTLWTSRFSACFASAETKIVTVLLWNWGSIGAATLRLLLTGETALRLIHARLEAAHAMIQSWIMMS
jgi:hypothetical protein